MLKIVHHQLPSRHGTKQMNVKMHERYLLKVHFSSDVCKVAKAISLHFLFQITHSNLKDIHLNVQFVVLPIKSYDVLWISQRESICKLVDWFLLDVDLHHERVKQTQKNE